jgi:hypothetical protein
VTVAQTPFSYLGQNYTIDDYGSIRTDGGLLVPNAQANIPLQQAGIAAVAAASPTGANATGAVQPTVVAPPADGTGTAAGGLPATPPRTGGLSAGASVHQTGTDSLTVPPKTAPVVPATPPRSGIGSDVTNRAQRDKLQTQLDQAMAAVDPTAGPTNAQATMIAALNTRISGLTTEISTNEKPKATNVISGTATPSDEFIVTEDPDHPGQFIKKPNPGADPALVAAAKQTRKPETHIVGNNIVTIGADGSMDSTQVNAQAQANEDLVAQAQATSAAASAANAAANKFAAESKAKIDAMVAAGTDAASERAAAQQEYDRLHQLWLEADGAAKTAQTQLDSANAERHATIKDTQTDTAEADRVAAEKQTSIDTRYGYDTQATTSKYASDTSAKSAAYTAKLTAATNLYQNSLSALAEINKTLPPGSDLAGKALEGMLAYGTKFLNGFAGGGGTDPAATSGVDPKKPMPTVTTPAPDLVTQADSTGGTNAALPPWSRADTAMTTPDPNTGLAPPGAAGTVSRDDPRYVGTDPAVMSGNQVFSGLAQGTGPIDTGAASNDALTQQLMAGNTAVHQATVAAPVAPAPPTLSPDGSPYASPEDVARAFGRQTTSVAQGPVAAGAR